MQKSIKIKYLYLASVLLISKIVIASEVPLCALPLVSIANTTKTAVDNAKVEGDVDLGCTAVYKSAMDILKASKSNIKLVNTTSTPLQLTVGTVYLQPITMAPDGMMRPRNKSDIHLEIDIHAKNNLKSRGFAPGDWLPNAQVTYSIQKIGDKKPLICGNANQTTCSLMSMVASDGPHYGDNVKLDGPGFYFVTFNAKTNPMKFGWHTDTDSKILGTEYVNWQFKQSYIFKFTGIGKKGGY